MNGTISYIGQIETCRKIMEAVADQYGVKASDLTGTRRYRFFAEPRHLAMYLCRSRTAMSLPGLGMLFGRHHTTVLYGVRCGERLCRDDSAAWAVSESVSALAEVS